MNISDIVALAKAGYKPNDIKELLELCETSPEVKQAGVMDLNKEKPDENKKIETKTENEIDPFTALAEREEKE